MRDSYDTEALEELLFGADNGREEEMEPDPEEWEAVELPGGGEPVMITADMEDGTQIEYMVAGVFLEGEKEYIALETREGDILIMELQRGEEDEVRLLPVEEEEEQKRAIDAFSYYFEQPQIINEIERENEDDRVKDGEED